MEGPTLGPGGEDITWPDQVAPRGRKASSTRKIKPQTSNPRVPPKGGDVRKHGGKPSRRDKHVTLAAISPPGVARGRCVGGQQSGLAESKPPPLFTRRASSCSSQGRRQGEP